MGFLDKFRKGKPQDPEPESHSNNDIAVERNTSANGIKTAEDADMLNGEDWGLKVLVEPTVKKDCIDIVAVHGVGANPANTWVYQNDGLKVDWLQDKAMLPKLVPNARIMRFGYNAKWFGGAKEQHTKTFVRHVSGQLLKLLRDLRKDSTRPLMFIAHSFGGLPVIHALRSSRDEPKVWGNAFQFTAGLLFFGVPFRGRNEGSPIEVWVERIAAAHMDDPTFQLWPETMSTSVPETQYLEETVGRYLETRACDHPIPVSCFHELNPSPVGKLWDGKDRTKYYLVPEVSACLDPSKGVTRDGLDRHHYNLQKFKGPDDPAWRVVVPRISKLAEDASAFLETRARAHEFLVTFSLYHLNATPQFVARDEYMQSMQHMLHKQTGRRSLVLSGAGGLGKTQLAIHYAQVHKGGYSAVFFLDITSKKSLEKSYGLIKARIAAEHPTARRLRAFSRSESEGQNSAHDVLAVNEWLELPNNTRWLMIFDNYDNPAIPGNTHSERVDIRAYLPEAGHGTVIVTTRVEAVELDSQRPMKVVKMSIRQGLQVLEKTSARQRIAENRSAHALATKLDGHPLALAVAGSYLATSAVSFEKYMALYEHRWKRLQQKSPGLSAYKYTLLTTWHITVEQLAEIHPPSVDMLKIFGYTYHRSVSYNWLKAGLRAMPRRVQPLVQDELDFHETMRHLIIYGLVELDQSPINQAEDATLAYTMHSVIHAWCEHDLNEHTNAELAWSVYISAILAAAVEITIPSDDIVRFRALIAKNTSAQQDLIQVWQENDNILKLLQRKKGFKIPLNWEALDFILGQLGHHGFLHHLDVPVDDFEEAIMFSENNGRCSVTILRSSFVPAELQDIIAGGHPKSYFVRWTRPSEAPRRQPGRLMSMEEMRAITRNRIEEKTGEHIWIAGGTVVSMRQWDALPMVSDTGRFTPWRQTLPVLSA